MQYITKVADQQSDNVPLVMFAAQTAALAQEFDTCRRYCNMVLDQSSEEETRSQVGSGLEWVGSEVGGGHYFDTTLAKYNITSNNRLKFIQTGSHTIFHWLI